MPDASKGRVRTSVSDPLCIAELPVGSHGGAVGVTFAPGKKQAQAMTGVWSRDLDLDLQAIREWGASTLISLLEPWEFDELQISNLPHKAKHYGLEWHGLPIVDGSAPSDAWLHAWQELGQSLANRLAAGERVVVHCKGGLGRAGTIASILLLQSGTFTDPASVITAVRSARPGAIETAEQESFIGRWAQELQTVAR